jgi:rfaE bifunctional protein kinase chain/domain/rfaE bifunctional protein nucleotidyltransferase chain/domain
MHRVTDKIKDLEEIASHLEQLKAQGKTIVMCHGVFDLMHPGHLYHLAAARKEGDILFVSITPDPYVNRGPDRPIFPQALRAEVIASLETVDLVAINKWKTAVEAIHFIKPDVYVKGGDYQDRSKDVTGGIRKEEKAIESVGGRIVFTNEITFSSSSLANRFMDVYPKETARFLKEFRSRTDDGEIFSRIEKLQSCKTLVIGDSIIDQYQYVTPMGKSPKENIIVTRYDSEESFAGGVLAAANHTAGLCGQVDLVTGIGAQDSHEEFIRSNLKKNVNPHLFTIKNTPTILKRRFVEPNYMRKLFEVCLLNGELIDEEVEREICQHLDKVIDSYDLVLVTDYGHGFMTPKIIDVVCRRSKFIAVNTQTNSANIGFNFITKYPHADYVCIDEPEARLALHDRVSDLEVVSGRLSAQLDAQHVCITHGNHGCLVFSKGEGLYKVPALTSSVIDTVGAGDAFLSISAPCVAMGFPAEQIGFIGNAAGALKVGIVGNRAAIEKALLLKFIGRLLK